MKLPRALASLTGPSTPESQKTFLRDLKQAFRERVAHRAAPLDLSIDRHLQQVLAMQRARPDVKLPGRVNHLNPSLAVRELYIEGKLTTTAVHDLLTRSTSKHDLDNIERYSSKAGIDIVSRPTDLSARYAAKLLHLGDIAKVKSMIERNTKQWILTQSAHPVLLQYSARSSSGIKQARRMFDHLVRLDGSNSTTPLVRCLLRESVRADSIADALFCLDLKPEAVRGQETGMARWLHQRGHQARAFQILTRAEPSLEKESSLGLDIARAFVQEREYDKASKVVDWVEKQYILSLQRPLRELRLEVAAHMTRGDPSRKKERQVHVSVQPTLA